MMQILVSSVGFRLNNFKFLLHIYLHQFMSMSHPNDHSCVFNTSEKENAEFQSVLLASCMLHYKC